MFSKLVQFDDDGWAVVEWERAIKHPEEGEAFVSDQMIRVTERAFEESAGSDTGTEANRKMLGLE